MNWRRSMLRGWLFISGGWTVLVLALSHSIGIPAFATSSRPILASADACATFAEKVGADPIACYLDAPPSMTVVAARIAMIVAIPPIGALIVGCLAAYIATHLKGKPIN